MKKFHELGWVHGDVKPNNILVAKGVNLKDLENINNKVKLHLIDYGLCQKINEK